MHAHTQKNMLWIAVPLQCRESASGSYQALVKDTEHEHVMQDDVGRVLGVKGHVGDRRVPLQPFEVQPVPLHLPAPVGVLLLLNGELKHLRRRSTAMRNTPTHQHTSISSQTKQKFRCHSHLFIYIFQYSHTFQVIILTVNMYTSDMLLTHTYIYILLSLLKQKI